MKSYQEKVITHYEKGFGNSASVYLWDKGPIEKLPSDFRILEFAPTKQRNMWTYATCCMSQPSDDTPIELHLFSYEKNEELIELLTSVTFYHRNTAKLGLSHTVDFGKSWQKASVCTYGLISLPYLDGPVLENLTLDNSKLVKCYWLIPITEEEVRFKKNFGVEALEEKFEQAGFNYPNPDRRSVV